MCGNIMIININQILGYLYHINKFMSEQTGICSFLFKEIPITLGIFLGVKYLPKLFKRSEKHKEFKPVYALLADVGGTNIRFELVLIQPPMDIPLETVKKGRVMVKDHDTFENAISDFLVGVTPKHYPEVASIAIAGPVDDNKVFMSNVLKWGKMNGETLGLHLKIRDFIFLNDFTANSYGLLLMKEDNFVSINGLQVDPDKTRGVLGPGTGLGNSIIFTAPLRNRKRAYVLPSQGGHIDYSYVDNESIQFFNFITTRSQFKYVGLERSFCGPAIPYMFQFFATKYSEYPNADEILTSEQIFTNYLNNPEADTLERKAVDFFLKLYCNAISNFIITHMCTGGLYLVGSLTNAVLEKLRTLDITAEYKKRHPQLSETIDKVPIVFSKELDLGLKGAFVYARRIIADQQHD